jgi:hypothetical protein
MKIKFKMKRSKYKTDNLKIFRIVRELERKRRIHDENSG